MCRLPTTFSRFSHRLRCRGHSCLTHRLRCRGHSCLTHRLRCRGHSCLTHRLRCRGHSCLTHRLRCRGHSCLTHRLRCRSNSGLTHWLRCRGHSCLTHRLRCRGHSCPTRITCTNWWPSSMQHSSKFQFLSLLFHLRYCQSSVVTVSARSRHCCNFFLSFLKAIVCFWADDFLFLGRLPAVGVTTVAPAPDPRAAGGCRRGHPFFTTGFSLKKINKAAVVFEIRQLQIQNISTHSINYEWQPVNYTVHQITVYKYVLVL